jgi:hypothetical protein
LNWRVFVRHNFDSKLLKSGLGFWRSQLYTIVCPGAWHSWHKRCDLANQAFKVVSKVVGSENKEGQKMLWTIFVVLLVLWLIGVVSSYTIGGFIHLLLVIALVMLLINLISGRRPVV